MSSFEAREAIKKDYEFRDWLKKVGAHISSVCGLGRDDLPDCCYRDWFDDGMSPKTAAKKAIKAAE